MTRTWHAVVCQGGGARGALQLGAIEAGALPSQVDVWIGTSTGALTALGMAGGGLAHLQSVYDHVARKGNKAVFKSPPFGKIGLGAAFLAKGAMYNPSPLRDLIRAAPAPTVPCGVTAYDTDTLAGRVIWLDQESEETRVAATLASSSVPGAFPAVEIPGHPGTWVDGGVNDVAPIEPAVRWLKEHAAPEDDLCVTVLMTSPPVVEPKKVRGIGVVFRTIDGLAHGVLVKDLEETERRNYRPGYREIRFRLVVPLLHWGAALDFSRVAEARAWMTRWVVYLDSVNVAAGWEAWMRHAASLLPDHAIRQARPQTTDAELTRWRSGT